MRTQSFFFFFFENTVLNSSDCMGLDETNFKTSPDFFKEGL